jgi:hypothetical protein
VLPPDNAIIHVPTAFEFPLFSPDETRYRITGNEVGAEGASLDINITHSTLGTLGREMRDIQMLEADESLMDAVPTVDASVIVGHGENDDTPQAITITQSAYTSYIKVEV